VFTVFFAPPFPPISSRIGKVFLFLRSTAHTLPAGCRGRGVDDPEAARFYTPVTAGTVKYYYAYYAYLHNHQFSTQFPDVSHRLENASGDHAFTPVGFGERSLD